MSFSEKEQAIREENRKVLETYFQVPHGSAEMMALMAPDCRWEQPYFRPGYVSPMFPDEAEEPPALPEGFTIPEFTPEWHWGPTTIHGTDDPNYFIAENTGWGKQLIGDNTLQDYHNHYFHTFRFNDTHKIIYYREVANPLFLMDTMKCAYEPLPTPEETIGKLIETYQREHNG